MFALDRSSRALLAALAFGAFGAAFVTTPIVARGAAGPIAGAALTVTPLPSRTAVAVVLPHRDPFADGDAPAVRSSASPAHAPNAFPAIPSFAVPPIPAALRALPPNAGAAASESPFANTARVTAVVTGPHPFALVDDAGTTRVLTVGERIGAAAIVAIDAAGVRLTDGTKLPVAAASAPAHLLPGGR